MNETPEAAFALEQIYLQSAAFGYRVDPITVPQNTPVQPQRISVQMAFEHLNGDEANRVRVNIITDDDDESALYLFQVEMAAIVTKVNRTLFPDPVLAEAVATMIFPFVREAVANLTSRGRFGPVWINPFDVRNTLSAALKQQNLESEQSTAAVE